MARQINVHRHTTTVVYIPKSVTYGEATPAQKKRFLDNIKNKNKRAIRNIKAGKPYKGRTK
jgi:flagellar hook assembly protein FlgD